MFCFLRQALAGLAWNLLWKQAGFELGRDLLVLPFKRCDHRAVLSFPVLLFFSSPLLSFFLSFLLVLFQIAQAGLELLLDPHAFTFLSSGIPGTFVVHRFTRRHNTCHGRWIKIKANKAGLGSANTNSQREWK